ncbi:pentapeptide repeat-containing protein [Streptomyces platensis]|uniref:pentapeptide repeat-containing protein n=1 Tax=Streptomyces platensis TaxID=58346 RepID=UPI003322FC15
MSGGDFSESWFTDAKLIHVNLSKENFYRADLQGADLAGASLVRANLDDGVLRDATLDAADFVRASGVLSARHGPVWPSSPPAWRAPPCPLWEE